MQVHTIRIYKAGILSAIGMPIMLLVYLYIKKSERSKCIEYNFSAEIYHLDNGNLMNLDNPVGNFIEFKLTGQHKSDSLVKTECYKILQKIYEDEKVYSSFDGFLVNIAELSTYADYIYFLNIMQIHGMSYYFFNENSFVCYFNTYYDKRKVNGIEFWQKCGTVGLNSLLKMKETYDKRKKRIPFTFKDIIRPHLNYWYFWLLYLLIVFFSVKKLKKEFQGSKP